MQDAEATESFINAMSVSANNPDKILKDISQILGSSMDSISALEMYQEIVAAYPNHVTGHLELFNISLSAGLEMDKLRVHIDNALAIDPGSDTAATTKFAFFLDQGKTEEGEAYAENHLMQFPDSYRLREIYADYLSRAGMIRMAIEQYQILPGPDALCSILPICIFARTGTRLRTKTSMLTYNKFQPTRLPISVLPRYLWN